MARYDLLVWDPTSAVGGAILRNADIGAFFGSGTTIDKIAKRAMKIALLSLFKKMRPVAKEGLQGSGSKPNSLGLEPRTVYESSSRRDPRSILRYAGSLDIGAMMAQNRPVAVGSKSIGKSAGARGNRVGRRATKIAGAATRPLFGKLSNAIRHKLTTDDGHGNEMPGGKLGFLAEFMSDKWQARVEHLVKGGDPAITAMEKYDQWSSWSYFGALGMPRQTPLSYRQMKARDVWGAVQDKFGDPVPYLEDRVVRAVEELLS